VRILRGEFRNGLGVNIQQTIPIRILLDPTRPVRGKSAVIRRAWGVVATHNRGQRKFTPRCRAMIIGRNYAAVKVARLRRVQSTRKHETSPQDSRQIHRTSLSLPLSLSSFYLVLSHPSQIDDADGDTGCARLARISRVSKKLALGKPESSPFVRPSLFLRPPQRVVSDVTKRRGGQHVNSLSTRRRHSIQIHQSRTRLPRV